VAKRFVNSAAFRQALEARLRTAADARNLSINDQRVKLVIERLLARLFAMPKAPWILKGGYAMELRYRPQARTTRDVDLSVSTTPANDLKARTTAIRDQLQEAADLDLGDYLVYRIGTPKGELPGAPLGGARFPVEVFLAEKLYGRFHLDLGFGDAVLGSPEPLVGDDLLAFAEIAPARVIAIPKPQQFAEKIHAYTFPWADRVNTRVKDLVDLVLFIERGNLSTTEVAAALRATFLTRKTHSLPETLPPPPASWSTEFRSMAAQAGLTTTDMKKAFDILSTYWRNERLGLA